MTITCRSFVSLISCVSSKCCYSEHPETLLKQLFVLMATLMTNVSAGLTLAFSGATNPALMAVDSTDFKITSEEASWVVAVIGISGVPGFLLLPIIMQVFGRKVVLFVINFLQLVGWVFIAFANNFSVLFLARIIQGFAIACPIVTSMVIAEYSDPSRRPYFIVMKKWAVSTGVLLCHILDLFWYWRQIAYFCFLFNAVGIILTILCPESPAYLAMKGKFEACEKSFVWLHGDNNGKELKDLIMIQKERIRNKEVETKQNGIKRFCKMFLERDFQKALILTIFVSIIIEAYGRHYFMAYIVQMMNELLNDKTKSLYFSIGNDCLTIAALMITGSIITVFKRRTLLFATGIVSVLIMLILGLSMFFKDEMGLTGVRIAIVILFYSFVTNIGVIPVAYSFLGEIYSLEHRGVGVAVSGVAFSVVTGASLKLSPMLMDHTGLSGIFLIYGALALVCLLFLFFMLPETNGKTLQEIEFEMKGIERSYTGEVTIVEPRSVEEVTMKPKSK